MTARESRLVAAARRHLPPAAAERWIALIRPALRLRAARPGEKRVGQLGGLPSLPDDTAWPEWEGEGSLTFVGSIDCGRLPSDRVDIALPDSGTLLFFYFDHEAGYFDPRYPPRTVSVRDPESLVGVRVMHVPADTPVAERATPSDIIEPYDDVPLTANPILTGPDWDHPAFRVACQDLSDADRAFLDEYDSSDAFYAAMSKLAPWPRHRLGGHATPVQEPVELDVAQAHLGVRAPYDNDQTMRAVQEEARRWTLLAQFDSDDDAGMQWGDVGTLYWLIRPEDLAAGNFDAASFTWQCT